MKPWRNFLLVVYVVLAASWCEAECLECLTATDATGPFFGAKDEYGAQQIQVYVTEESVNARWFNQEALDNAIGTWNRECQSAGLPPLVLNWAVAPAGADPAATLIFDYNSDEKAIPVIDPETGKKGLHPAGNAGNEVSLDGLCPDDKGWDITCGGLNGRFIDWTSLGGEAALVHEIGHTFGLGHENDGCSGIMAAELNWSRPNSLSSRHCDLAHKLNSTKVLCQNLPAVNSQHSCTRCTWPLAGSIEGLEGEEVVAITMTASAGHLKSEHTTTARKEFSLPEIVEGAAYALEVSAPMSQGTVNEDKSCVVKEPGHGIVPNGGFSGIVIECQCDSRPPTDGEDSVTSSRILHAAARRSDLRDRSGHGRRHLPPHPHLLRWAGPRPLVARRGAVVRRVPRANVHFTNTSSRPPSRATSTAHEQCRRANRPDSKSGAEGA